MNWLTEWFKSQCNGDWEHENQIQIYTVDNPGWVVKIDLRNTMLEKLEVEYKLVEKDENDWYGFSIKNAVYDGAGDLDKLELLINKFREIVETTTKDTIQ